MNWKPLNQAGSKRTRNNKNNRLRQQWWQQQRVASHQDQCVLKRSSWSKQSGLWESRLLSARAACKEQKAFASFTKWVCSNIWGLSKHRTVWYKTMIKHETLGFPTTFSQPISSPPYQHVKRFRWLPGAVSTDNTGKRHACVSADFASIVSRSETMPLKVFIIWSLPALHQGLAWGNDMEMTWNDSIHLQTWWRFVSDAWRCTN